MSVDNTTQKRYTVFVTQIGKEAVAMTHSKEDIQRIAELNSAFMSLNDKGKDSALTILRSLKFAQDVMGADTYGAERKTNHQQTGRIG